MVASCHLEPAGPGCLGFDDQERSGNTGVNALKGEGGKTGRARLKLVYNKVMYDTAKLILHCGSTSNL